MASSIEPGDTTAASAAAAASASAAAASQGDEDLVVDSLGVDAPADDIQQPQQQLLYSLDQAILHSIDRCCEYRDRCIFDPKTSSEMAGRDDDC